MHVANKEETSGSCYCAFIAFGLAIYVLYQAWRFLARPDALEQIGELLGGIGLCLGAGLVFILTLSIGSSIHTRLSSFSLRKRIEHTRLQRVKSVNRILGQTTAGEPLLTKEIILFLANESSYRTQNADITFTDIGGYEGS